MALNLDLQTAWQGPSPSHAQFHRWALTALMQAENPSARLVSDLCIRIEDEAGMAALNERYRQRSGPTNVLSFQFEAPPGLPEHVASGMLGDLILCGPLVQSEAAVLEKDTEEHWALLTVHGVLHMLGYDHQQAEDWQQMTSLEERILISLGMHPPYRVED